MLLRSDLARSELVFHAMADEGVADSSAHGTLDFDAQCSPKGLPADVRGSPHIPHGTDAGSSAGGSAVGAAHDPVPAVLPAADRDVVVAPGLEGGGLGPAAAGDGDRAAGFLETCRGGVVPTVGAVGKVTVVSSLHPRAAS